MLDLLGERAPFYESEAKIATIADKRKIELCVSALSYATISNFLKKFEGIEKTKDKLRKFKVISEICKLDEKNREGIKFRFFRLRRYLAIF